MNRIKKFLIKVGLVKAKPHEKAELGQDTWGRQTEPSNVLPTSTKPKASINIRVYRAETNTWEEK